MKRNTNTFTLRLVALCCASLTTFAQQPTNTFPSLLGLNTDTVDSDMAWRLRAVAEGRQVKLNIADLGRSSPDFQILLDGYITAYGLLCSQYLPADKVEWTIPRCEESARDSNGDFECVREGQYHTHVYVDKNVLDLKHSLLVRISGQKEVRPDGTYVPLPDLQETIDKLRSPQIRSYYSKLWLAPGQLGRVHTVI